VPDQPGNAWTLRDDSVAASLEVARAVHPPTGRCALERGWAGLEAFTPDDLPVLGPVPGLDNVLLAAGFSGHGFALSPIVGEALAGLALGTEARSELWTGLGAERFTFTTVRRQERAHA
jgi:glycine/D-amino acid oxidase-like deaminating enzyme